MVISRKVYDRSAETKRKSKTLQSLKSIDRLDVRMISVKIVYFQQGSFTLARSYSLSSN